MGCGYNKVVTFSITAVSGTLFTIYISSAIESRLQIIRRILYYIGNHTLDILALHFLSFRLVSFVIVLLYGINFSHVAEHPVIKDVSISHEYWWILYCTIGIVLPLLLGAAWKVIMIKIKRS